MKNKIHLSLIVFFTAASLLIAYYFLSYFWLLLVGCALVFFALSLCLPVFEKAGVILFATFFSLTLVELVVPYFDKEKNSGVYYENVPPYSEYSKYNITNADIGHSARPGIYHRKKLTNDGEVIYDVIYSIGADGFRITNDESLDHVPRINFYGCSFTFGAGLNDDETLPYYFKNKFKNVSVKNFGFHGYGAHDALAILQSKRDTKGDINFFLTAPWHAPRSACVQQWTAGSPRYRLTDAGKVERVGRCNDKKNMGFVQKFFEQSDLFNFIKETILSLPSSQDAQIDLYLALVKEIAEISRQRNQKFIIGFIKAKDDWFKGSYTNEKVFQQLSGLDAEIINLSLTPSDEKLSRRYYIHELDKHPSAEANRERAEKLASMLEGMIANKQ